LNEEQYYLAEVPFCGSFYARVKATDKNDAIDKALRLADTMTITDVEGNELELNVWECLEYVVQGNFFFGPTSHIDIEPDEDQED